MTELTKRQKYIKEKYFELKRGDDPVYYCPISDKTLNLAHHSLIRIINLVIKILEEEYDGELKWEKTT